MHDTSQAPVLLTQQEGVAEIRFNRPDSMNALTEETGKLARRIASGPPHQQAVTQRLLRGSVS